MGKVTLKIVQKYEVNAEGRYVVRLRITANRSSRFVASPVEVTKALFNPKGKRESLDWIRSRHPNADTYNNMLKELWDRAVAAVDELGASATADQVKARIENGQPGELLADESVPVASSLPTFLEYCNLYIKRRGESSTTDTYIDARRVFTRYLAAASLPDVTFEQVTVAFLKGWRAWALSKYANNTVWLAHSRLKSMHFQAVEDFPALTSVAAVVSDPFRRVTIKKLRTKKQRLYEDEIERLAGLDLKWGTALREARDICLMMYYAQGMRIGDAVRLRARHYVTIDTHAIVNGRAQPITEHRLIYNMQKGKKIKNALLPRQAIDLLAPYRAEVRSPDDTLFRFFRKEIDAGFSTYRLNRKAKAKAANIRSRLTELMEMAGVDKQVSPHVFRHSFADLARRNGMDWMDIQRAMGHERFSTTEGYMEDLDESSADMAVDLFARKPGQQPDNIDENKQA